MPPQKVRFVTFNVCGIKGILSRSAQWVDNNSLESMFSALEADVVCFQETKIQSNDITRDMALVPHFNSYFTCSLGRKGYSGVAFYVRDTIKVLKAEEGLTGTLLTGSPGNRSAYKTKPTAFPASIYPEGMKENHARKLDEQGRSITLDLGSCIVIGVYCPADSQGNMGDFREEFFQLLDWRITKFRELNREVVVLGDLNVAREPRDSAPLRDLAFKEKREIITEEWKYGTVPRKAVNDWVEQWGLVDSTRRFHDTRLHMYTCWDQQKNCRPANYGSRLDYILVSKGIECVDADIMAELVGSDHCPVYADVILDVEPQNGVKLPYLSWSLADRWNNNLQAFFQREPILKRPKTVLTNVTKTSIKNPMNKTPRKAVKTLTSPMTTETLTATTAIPTTAIPTAPTLPTAPTPITSSAETSTAPTAKKQLSISQMFGASNDSWLGINSKLSPPLCEHREPCVLKKSSKPPRKGEYFWICNRAQGATRGGSFRCRTFIWDTERRGI